MNMVVLIKDINTETPQISNNKLSSILIKNSAMQTFTKAHFLDDYV